MSSPFRLHTASQSSVRGLSEFKHSRGPRRLRGPARARPVPAWCSHGLSSLTSPSSPLPARRMAGQNFQATVQTSRRSRPATEDVPRLCRPRAPAPSYLPSSSSPLSTGRKKGGLPPGLRRGYRKASTAGNIGHEIEEIAMPPARTWSVIRDPLVCIRPRLAPLARSRRRWSFPLTANCAAAGQGSRPGAVLRPGTCRW